MQIAPRDHREVHEAADGVHLAQLVQGESLGVQYFRIDPGARVPEHAHPHEQAGYLTAGVLTFEVDRAVVNGDPVAETVRVTPDDAYLIPGDEPHAAVNDGDGLVEGIDVFSPPRDDLPWE